MGSGMTNRNIGITPGTGDGVAFDGNVQRVKIAHGAEGYQEDATYGTPLPVESRVNPADILQLAIHLDGFPASISARVSATYPTTRTSQTSMVATNVGEALFCSFIHICARHVTTPGTPVECQVTIDRTPALSLYALTDIRVMVDGVVVSPLNKILHHNPTFTLYLENGDNTSTVVVRMCAYGWRITDDFNLHARRTVLWVGDSIARGSGLPAGGSTLQKDQMYTFAVRNYLNASGHDYRLIVKATGGMTTTLGEQWRKDGVIDTSCPYKAGLVFYQLGTNDSAAPATALTNLGLFVPWALQRFPLAIIVVLGPPPAENNTTEAGLVTIRSNYASYVSGLANARVQFVDLGSAFDRTVTSNYSTSDTPGSRVHPSAAGMVAMSAVLTDFIDTITVP
jgi:lysophospholipase L1-like esterase